MERGYLVKRQNKVPTPVLGEIHGDEGVVGIVLNRPMMESDEPSESKQDCDGDEKPER